MELLTPLVIASMMGLVIVLAFLALFRVLDTTPKQNKPSLAVVLIDGYAMLNTAFIALILYVILVRAGILENQDSRNVYVMMLAIYLLGTKIVTVYRMLGWFKRMVFRIRTRDNSGRQGTREVSIVEGKLRVATPLDDMDGEGDVE